MDSAHSGDLVEGHALRVVDQELADLRLRTLTLGSLAIDQVSVAVTSLLRAEQSLAGKVLAREPLVNELAREIDRRAFEALALRQLLSGDLRLTRAISRTVVELQRASDQCRTLARRGAAAMSDQTPSPRRLACPALAVC